MDIKILSEHFLIYGDFKEAKPFGNGNINDTYLVSYRQAGLNARYIIRKINKYVFKKPEIVVNNSVNISAHIKNELLKSGEENISMKTMTFVKSRDNKYFVTDENDDYWCAVLYFEGAYTIDYVQNAEQAYKAAYAFGNFQKLIINADVNKYGETIPGFHNLPSRIEALKNAVAADVAGRVKEVSAELDEVEKNMGISEQFTKLINSKELPVRITHNDTKINNVMLDKTTYEGLCVIDLDTVMPGIILNDFGDMVRTSTSPVTEEEKDFSKVYLQIDIFEALTKGYLKPLSNIVTKMELNNLVFGAKLIVFEQAVRFISDYIAGDVYYPVAYETNNLVRAKNQFALLNSILRQETEMEKIVQKYI